MDKEISFTEGPVFSSLVRFALPVFGALILQAAYGAVDLLVVGWFGSAASIAAVGTGSAFMQMVTFVITSLAMGSTVVIGHHVGAKDRDRAGCAVGTSIILFLIIGIVLTVVLELSAGSIASLMRVPEASHDMAVGYIRICSAGIIVIIAYNVISSILRGVGDANLPLIFVAVACVVNIIGDFLLVGYFKMDASGAAYATVAAQGVSVIVSLFALKKRKLDIAFDRKKLKIDPVEIKRILSVGVPIALQETMVQISFLVLNSIVNGMGLMPSAGYGVAQKIVSFIMLLPSSLMQSVSAFSAQNIGAGLRERAKKGLKTAIACGCSLGTLFFIVGFFFGGAMSSLFTSEKEVINQSALFLKGFSPECILTCMLFSLIGFFNGSGRSVPVMVQGMGSAFLIRIPLALIFSRLENSSLFLIGLATPITTVCGIVFLICCFIHYKRRKMI